MNTLSKTLIVLTASVGLVFCLTSNAAINGNWYTTWVGSYYEIHNYTPSPTYVQNTSPTDCNVYVGMGVAGNVTGPSTGDSDWAYSTIDCGYTKTRYLPTISGYFAGFPDTPGEYCIAGSYGKDLGSIVAEFDMPGSPICQTT